MFYVNVLVLMSFSIYGQFPCIDGMANGYPCSNVDLQSFTSKIDMGTTAPGKLNDVWGWTDPVTGKEYALVGLTNGTSFVDVSDPVNPVYLGILPTETSNSSWRDIKTIGDFAYIGSEASGHGIQSFDLKTLRNVSNPPMTFTALDLFSEIGFGGSHNVVALEDSDHLVVVGARGTGGCSGGLIFVDVSDPANMRLEGCFASDGYTHDAVCFTYRGPDTEHFGKEICIGSNEDTQTIVDVTDKANPIQLSRTEYPLSRYTHQGWVTDDHRFLLFDDELDERTYSENTKTYVMDISDLDNPLYVDFYVGSTRAIDHNLYIKGQYAFQANYEAGFRMLDVRNTSTADFTEVAFFDNYPTGNNANFEGAWSVYPYFESGNILISDIQGGLFIVKPTVPFFTISSEKIPKTYIAGEDIIFNIDLKSYSGYNEAVTLSLDSDISGATESFGSTSITPDGSTTLTISNTDNLQGAYHLVIQGRGPSDNVVHDVAISFNIIPRLYVDQSKVVSGNGSRWNRAFNSIPEALANVPSAGAEIWVAQGTYLPTNTADRNISFEIPDGVSLYGGFIGTESDTSGRDFVSNPTVLSGNIGLPSTKSDNTFHVVKTSGVRSACTIDGFTISDGNANDEGNVLGGGLLSSNFTTVIRNCTFTENFASSGSAIYNDGSILTLINCEIVGLDSEMIVNSSSKMQVRGNVILRKD